MKGYFTVRENEHEAFDIECDLRPDVVTEVPDIMSELYSEIESTCNIIKSLEKTSEEIKRKYFNKLLSLAQVGLVPEEGAQPRMAKIALNKLRAEILLVEGKRIKNQYMRRLGIIAGVLAIIVGIGSKIMNFFTDSVVCNMIGCTWIGAMGGAWVSYGARKFQLEFEDLSVMEKDMVEPIMRLIYIGICSLIFELFLACGIATISVGDITSAMVVDNAEIQMLIGVICGLIESKIGINIYKKANDALQIQDTE